MPKDIIKRIAADEASKRTEHQISCHIIQYIPNGPGGPTAIVVPKSRMKNALYYYETRDELMKEWALEVQVVFPEGIRFHVDPDRYDLVIDQEYLYAQRGYPVLKPEHRRASATVPRGVPDQQVNATATPVTPDNIKARAQVVLNDNPFALCSELPQYPTDTDFWVGPLRHAIDSKRAEIWVDANSRVQKISRQAAEWAAKKLSFPITDGATVRWKGRIENPLQNMVSSTAVTPYRRFIYSLVDPSLIVGAVQGILAFLETLDQDNRYNVYTSYRYEVVDYTREVPEI